MYHCCITQTQNIIQKYKYKNTNTNTNTKIGGVTLPNSPAKTLGRCAEFTLGLLITSFTLEEREAKNG
jgi:hypothetical protein